LLLGWSLIGAAFGALVGSLSGLTLRAEDEQDTSDDDRRVVAPGFLTATHPRGAAVGAVMGTVALGPVGLPLGAVAGALYDALQPRPGAPSSHTHNIEITPCYDGCPAYHSLRP
jgi:hypothetical protein